jgi:hypothetical protein
VQFLILLIDLLQFMQQSLHWIPRVFNQNEILLHWDFYKIHIFFSYQNPSEISQTIFGLIDPAQRLNDVSYHNDAPLKRDIDTVVSQGYHAQCTNRTHATTTEDQRRFGSCVAESILSPATRSSYPQFYQATVLHLPC